jgi:hypothetical protein
MSQALVSVKVVPALSFRDAHHEERTGISLSRSWSAIHVNYSL